MDTYSIVIPIKGGGSYKKNFKNETKIQLQKLNILFSELQKRKTDVYFYLKTLRDKLKYLPLRFLNVDNTFSVVYDSQLIYRYILKAIESNDIIYILYLLKLNEPLNAAIHHNRKHKAIHQTKLIGETSVKTHSTKTPIELVVALDYIINPLTELINRNIDIIEKEHINIISQSNNIYADIQ